MGVEKKIDKHTRQTKTTLTTSDMQIVLNRKQDARRETS